MKCQICNRKKAMVIWMVLNLCEDCNQKQKQRQKEKGLEVIRK